jgi:hypothetical protein
MQRIPKIAHFIWSNPDGLPFSRFLSIATFAALNPDFDINFHTFETLYTKSKFQGGENSLAKVALDYTPNLKLIPGLRIIKHDQTSHGLSLTTAPSSVTDCLRFYILASQGGFYFDTDIIFLSPLKHAYFASRMYSHISLIIHKTHLTTPSAYRIGLLASSGDSALMKKSYDLSILNYDPLEYQSCGSHCMNMVFGPVDNIGTHSFFHSDSVGEYPHNLLGSYCYKYALRSMEANFSFPEAKCLLTPSPIFGAIHWYGGGARAIPDNLSELDFNLKKNQDNYSKNCITSNSFLYHIFRAGVAIVNHSSPNTLSLVAPPSN